MTTTKKVLKVAALRALDGAKDVSARVARNAGRQMAMAADAALVEAGRNAKRRQRRRSVARVLRFAGKAAVVAGTATATVMAVRARKAKA